MPGPEGCPEKHNAGRWQVGEELLGGGDPVFVTCSRPRLPASCTSLGFGNAGRMSKEWGVGRLVSCSWRSGGGKQGPQGRRGKGRGTGKVEKALLLEMHPAQVGWDPRTQGSKQEASLGGRQSPGSVWMAIGAAPDYL